MQSYALHLITTRLIAIDLMTLDIAAMVMRTLANGVVERADVIWHVCSE